MNGLSSGQAPRTFYSRRDVMELRTIRKADVPEYFRASAFFLALDGEEDEEFSIAAPYFKDDTAIADEGSSRNLLHTLRFWGVDTIPASVCDAAFDQDCHFFVSVAFEFVKELKYLKELIQLRLVPPEFRLECACQIGNLQILRWLVRNGSNSSNGSNAISRVCLEAAAREGHVHVIRFLHFSEVDATGAALATLPLAVDIYPVLSMYSSEPRPS